MIFYDSFLASANSSCTCDYHCDDSPTCQSCDD